MRCLLVPLLLLAFFRGQAATATRSARPGPAPTAAPAAVPATPNVASQAPEIPREFRAAWVATVKNVDWPSRPGLPVAQQQSELRALLDLAVRLNLNALIFQVRPAADAFYDSNFEPWSEFLTGQQGQRPQPFWDPLLFAVSEAHTRGLELHAWFNPFRARMQANAPAATNHVSRRFPHLVRNFGSELWLDPGESDAREHAIRVILDVVRRYDIDGVHLDDYFYPYPLGGVKGAFPDDRSWQRYERSGGRLNRDDWRRENVDTFVEQLSTSIHREKSWVRFGISPFGIWRPNNPPGIRGMDAFEAIYADSRKWLQSAWVDYLAPQLYWPINPREQSFPSLLNWWIAQDTQGVPIWPGIATARIGQDRNVQEIANQIRLVRRQANSNGLFFWNMSSLRVNQGGIANLLTNQLFTNPTIVPELRAGAPPPPEAPDLNPDLNAAGTRLNLQWTPATNEPVRRFVLQTRFNNGWRAEFFGDARTQRLFDRARGDLIPLEVLLTPIGRSGVAGEPAHWTRPVVATPPPAARPVPAAPRTTKPAAPPRPTVKPASTNSPAKNSTTNAPARSTPTEETPARRPAEPATDGPQN